MYFEWVPLNNAADGETSAGVDEIVPCWLRTDEENVALNRELLRLLWMEPLNSLYPSENNRILTFPSANMIFKNFVALVHQMVKNTSIIEIGW